MRQVYLFDLYDTVLKDISFEFQRGMRFLYDCYFSTVCSWEDFSAYEDTFSPLYEQRKVNNTEISLIYDEVLPIFRKFGIVPPADLDELDFQIMDHMQEETLLPSVRQTLEKLYGRGFHMYILSNAIFTAKSARRLLRRFGIDGYFRRVYSSADHGFNYYATLTPISGGRTDGSNRGHRLVKLANASSRALISDANHVVFTANTWPVIDSTNKYVIQYRHSRTANVIATDGSVHNVHWKENTFDLKKTFR